MKILLAIDGSEYSKRMLAYVAAHDEWLGASQQYTLIHVVPAVPPRAAKLLGKATLESYYEDEAEKVFKPVRAFFAKQKLAASFVVKVGTAADAVVALADKGGFDLLMMGSHGHGSVANLVLGSVATKVMANCRVPVLLVR